MKGVRKPKNRPESALIPIPSTRFPNPHFPRLTLGDSTTIRRHETSRLQARLQETSPEQYPDRKRSPEKNGPLAGPAWHEWFPRGHLRKKPTCLPKTRTTIFPYLDKPHLTQLFFPRNYSFLLTIL